ncbi:hypothetical protein KJA14_02010 [Patescibacteria group bacterium]|nr:hypothetical protein [Patescibacteria group bacterium]
MERRWIERIRKMGNEELLKTTRRGGLLSLKIAEEIFSRILEGGITDEDKYLRAILESIKVGGGPKTQRKAKEMKEKASKTMIEKGYLDERNLSTILREINSQKILERAVRKCLAKDGNIPNYLLREMIRRIKSLSLKETLAKRILNQNPNTDDLLVIVEELEGSPLQIEAEEKLWKREMEPENFTWLTGFGSPSQAERNWERGKREGMIEKLSEDDLSEILRYTDSQEIKEEMMEILLNLEDLTIDHLRPVVEALESIKVDEETLKKIMDRLESLRSVTEKKISEKGKNKWEQSETLDSIGKLKQKVKEVFKNLKEGNELAKASFLAEAGNEILSSFYFLIDLSFLKN